MSGNPLLQIGYRNNSGLYEDISSEAADSIREFIGCIANLKTQKEQIKVEEALAKGLPHFFDKRFNRLVALKSKTCFWSCGVEFDMVVFRLIDGDYCNNLELLGAIKHEARLALVRYNEYVFGLGDAIVA